MRAEGLRPSWAPAYTYMYIGCGVLLCLVVVCLTLLASFFLPSHLSLNMYMYIHGLVFGVIGGFITPAFSFILS